jgi:hypothetical protein
MILLCWLFAYYVQPLLKNEESVSFTFRSYSCKIYKPPLYLWFLGVVFLLSGSFWKTSLFFLFQEIYTKTLYYDSILIQFNTIQISNRIFNFSLASLALYFSMYAYYFLVIQSVIYGIICYKETLAPYYCSVLIFILKHWTRLKNKVLSFKFIQKLKFM